jgi:hypothetical protein
VLGSYGLEIWRGVVWYVGSNILQESVVFIFYRHDLGSRLLRKLCTVTSIELCTFTSYMTAVSVLNSLGWVHTCNVTAFRNTVSWQCWRDSWPRNVSKVGYAVTLRARSVCCRYLAVASKGWYGYGRSRCGRATSRCTSTPLPAVTVSFLWCDGQIPTAHRTSP